jgi:hypothetical protein
MARWRRFRRGPDGTVVISLAPHELEQFVQLPDQLRDVYDAPPDDPARARLFPRAYLDPTAEDEEEQWQELVFPELLRERAAQLAVLTDSFGRAQAVGEWREIALSPDEVQAWLGVLNDLRLALGARLEITAERTYVAPDDPRAPAFEVYDWLTYIEGDLVEHLLG